MLKLLLSRLDPADLDAGALTQAGFYDWQDLEHGRNIALPDLRGALQ
jgi:hypothetical protein